MPFPRSQVGHKSGVLRPTCDLHFLHQNHTPSFLQNVFMARKCSERVLNPPSLRSPNLVLFFATLLPPASSSDPPTIVQSGQQNCCQQRYVSYFQRQFCDINPLIVQCIMYQFLRRLRYSYEYILNSYFQLLAASFFDIRTQEVSNVSCTNSYVDLEICMSILQTASMCCWQHDFRHMNIQCCQKYLILAPTQQHEFV